MSIRRVRRRPRTEAGTRSGSQGQATGPRRRTSRRHPTGRERPRPGPDRPSPAHRLVRCRPPSTPRPRTRGTHGAGTSWPAARAARGREAESRATAAAARSNCSNSWTRSRASSTVPSSGIAASGNAAGPPSPAPTACHASNSARSSRGSPPAVRASGHVGAVKLAAGDPREQLGATCDRGERIVDRQLARPLRPPRRSVVCESNASPSATRARELCGWRSSTSRNWRSAASAAPAS